MKKKYLLAKKYQYKFGYNFLNSNSSLYFKRSTNNKYVNDSNYSQLILRALHSSNQYICNSDIEFKGTLYKVGYFLTNFINEICVYAILEIIFVKEKCKVF